MKDLQKRVQRILTDNEYARGNDNILYIEVVKDYGYSRNISLLLMADLVMNRVLPSIETVGRIRRKVQELHPELLPAEEVQLFREVREKMFKEYALGVR